MLGFFPASPCPHGRVIHEGDYCPVCQGLHPSLQHAVDRSKPPLPQNPEDRALEQIRYLKAMLASDLPARDAIEIRERIKNLEATVKDWSGQPTTFTQTQRGGKGDVKAKAIWTMAGMKDKVQAHTKSEARALFKRILGIPADGRLPVGAALSKAT